jgi:hypothetical protein
MSKIRKAVVAALTAAAGSVLTAITTHGLPTDTSGWTALLGAAVVVGLGAGLAVYGTPNAPAVTRPSADPVRRSFPPAL